jgi:hypothetical protein
MKPVSDISRRVILAQAAGLAYRDEFWGPTTGADRGLWRAEARMGPRAPVLEAANVEVAAVCEVDENVLNGRLRDMEKLKLAKPATYIDVRKLMEDKSIDAVSITTTHSWHTLIAIWACQAGKDVYVEKPCSHKLVGRTATDQRGEEYNRIVQHGTRGARGNPRWRP